MPRRRWSPPKVHFHEAQCLGSEALAETQVKVRVRLLRALARRGLLEREDAKAIGAWEHGGGFSLADQDPERA